MTANTFNNELKMVHIMKKLRDWMRKADRTWTMTSDSVPSLNRSNRWSKRETRRSILLNKNLHLLLPLDGFGSQRFRTVSAEILMYLAIYQN